MPAWSSPSHTVDQARARSRAGRRTGRARICGHGVGRARGAAWRGSPGWRARSAGRAARRPRPRAAAGAGRSAAGAARAEHHLAVVLEEAVAERVRAAAGGARPAGCGRAGTARPAARCRRGRRRWSAPAVETAVSRSSASAWPSRAATASWSSRPSRSRPRPVTTCTASRTSSSAACASSTAPCGRSASQAAARARRDGHVAQPAVGLLELGLERLREVALPRCAAACEGLDELGQPPAGVGRASRGPPWTARPRHDVRRPPRRGVRSSRPTAALRSSAATLRHWVTVRTLWSSRTPASQTGYQMRSASARSSLRGERAAVVQQDEVEVAERSGVAAGRAADRGERDALAGAGPRPRGPRCPASHSRSKRRRWPPGAPGRRPGRSKSRVPARSRRECGEADLCSIGRIVAQSASTPRSPVRTRTTSSTGTVQILPSPIRPVWAALRMTSTTLSASMSSTRTSRRHLRHEVDGVLGAAVDLAVAPLAAVAAGLADRHARDAEGLEGLLHLVELVRLDDRGDELHALSSFEVLLG